MDCRHPDFQAALALERRRGETVTREQVAAEFVRRRPEWANMIEDSEGPCPLCWA